MKTTKTTTTYNAAQAKIAVLIYKEDPTAENKAAANNALTKVEDFRTKAQLRYKMNWE